MSLIVKCDYCKKEVTDYHKIYSYENNVQASVTPAYVCYACAYGGIGHFGAWIEHKEAQHDK